MAAVEGTLNCSRKWMVTRRVPVADGHTERAQWKRTRGLAGLGGLSRSALDSLDVAGPTFGSRVTTVEM